MSRSGRVTGARGIGLLAAAICLLAGSGMPALRAQDMYQYPSRVQIAWDRLNDYDEVVSICRSLVAAYPDLLTMEAIGTSVQGREMWALTLNVPRTGPAQRKPAVYMDGNIHGNEVQAAEVILYSIWYLTKSYGRVEQLTRLMDRCAFYFVPMVNPDGRAYWMEQPHSQHSGRSGMQPVDDDGDGLFDEDPPNDIDGDGLILQMRREDPDGRWRESADDYRLMIPADPQAKGDFKRYTLLGDEGIDDDEDGLINEDGPGGYDMNRSWPTDWQPNYIQGGAGDYPLCFPETACIARFILAHPNIAAIQAYHNSAGMILRAPGANYTQLPQPDVYTYDRIGQRGEKILPFYRYAIIWSGLYTTHGNFLDWTAVGLGIPSFTNELWSERKYYPNKPEPPTPKEEMEFNDYVMFGQSFVPWKKFQHPTYGAIELGGWVKLHGRVPPSFHLEEECHRNFAFTMYHAEQMPLIELTDLEAKPLAPGLWQIRVDVHNRRLIASTTAQQAAMQYGPRDFVEIAGNDVRVLAGGTLADRFAAPFEFVQHEPQRLWIDDGIPGEGCRTFQWLVSGSGPVTVRFAGARAGEAAATIELRDRTP